MNAATEAAIVASFSISTVNNPLKGLQAWLQHFDGVGSKSLVAAYNHGILYQKQAIARVWHDVHKKPLDTQKNEIWSRLKSYVNPDPYLQDGGKRRLVTTKRRRIRRYRRTLRRI